MRTDTPKTIVGVFSDRAEAQKAVTELKRRGFSDDQIGVVSRQDESPAAEGDQEGETYAGEGAAAGLATGAGVGALWGLGILAGVLPAIGPAIAGGTLAALLSSAAAGAATAGLVGTLVGLGMSKEEAEYYESEFKAGRTIVTVNAGARSSEAASLLRQFGATNISDRMETTGSATATGPTTTGAGYGRPSGSILNEDRDETTHRDTRSRDLAGTSPAARARATDKDTLQATEEELRVHKDMHQTGEVKLGKEVHTEQKTINVPVEREEVVIERHPVSGHQPAAGGTTGSQEIRVPVREEQVHVEKTPVVKEEVSVGKRKTRDTQNVTESIRKEDIKVETEGQANVRDRQ